MYMYMSGVQIAIFLELIFRNAKRPITVGSIEDRTQFLFVFVFCFCWVSFYSCLTLKNNAIHHFREALKLFLCNIVIERSPFLTFVGFLINRDFTESASDSR